MENSKRNIVGTHLELGKNGKKIKILPLAPPNLKGNKTRQVECMLGRSHWLHEISLPKRICCHFWPGLIPLAKEHNTHYKLGVLIYCVSY
jgi:hypothetical protein